VNKLCSLDIICYYLSYTSFIPVVSTSFGIVSIIRELGTQVKPPEENLRDLLDRKIDLLPFTKGALACLPVLGNLILMCKWASKQLELMRFFSDIPKQALLYNDKELFLATFKHQQGWHFRWIFPNMPNKYKDDKEFILQLINSNIFTPNTYYTHLSQRLKEDRDIALAILHKDQYGVFIFKELPEKFKNDLEIIRAATCWAKRWPLNYKDILPHVPKEVLLNNEKELRIASLECGALKYADLCKEDKKKLEYGMAAVWYDCFQWKELYPKLRHKKKLINKLVESLVIGNQEFDLKKVREEIPPLRRGYPALQSASAMRTASKKLNTIR